MKYLIILLLSITFIHLSYAGENYSVPGYSGELEGKPFKRGTLIYTPDRYAIWFKDSSGHYFSINGGAKTLTGIPFKGGNVFEYFDVAREGIASQAEENLQEKYLQGNFVTNRDSILGEWYPIALNLAYHNKVITDYKKYTFDNKGNVRLWKNLDGVIEREKGKYSFDDSKKVFILQFRRGKAGIQEEYWKQESDGIIRFFYFNNITHGIKLDMDELFIKKNSVEWKQREKIKINE